MDKRTIAQAARIALHTWQFVLRAPSSDLELFALIFTASPDVRSVFHSRFDVSEVDGNARLKAHANKVFQLVAMGLQKLENMEDLPETLRVRVSCFFFFRVGVCCCATLCACEWCLRQSAIESFG